MSTYEQARYPAKKEMLYLLLDELDMELDCSSRKPGGDRAGITSTECVQILIHPTVCAAADHPGRGR